MLDLNHGCKNKADQTKSDDSKASTYRLLHLLPNHRLQEFDQKITEEQALLHQTNRKSTRTDWNARRTQEAGSGLHEHGTELNTRTNGKEHDERRSVGHLVKRRARLWSVCTAPGTGVGSAATEPAPVLGYHEMYSYQQKVDRRTHREKERPPNRRNPTQNSLKRPKLGLDEIQRSMNSSPRNHHLGQPQTPGNRDRSQAQKLGKNSWTQWRKSQTKYMNSGGQPEDSGLHFHSKITGSLHRFRICGPLSRKLREREKTSGRKK
jgi:hypothetical protein